MSKNEEIYKHYLSTDPEEHKINLRTTYCHGVGVWAKRVIKYKQYIRPERLYEVESTGVRLANCDDDVFYTYEELVRTDDLRDTLVDDWRKGRFKGWSFWLVDALIRATLPDKWKRDHKKALTKSRVKAEQTQQKSNELRFDPVDKIHTAISFPYTPPKPKKKPTPKPPKPSAKDMGDCFDGLDDDE